MATKHWVRDVPLTDPQNYIANGNHMQGNALLYNFLRVAGWEWLWECDGQLGQYGYDPNHVPDGNAQVDSTTYWSSYSGGVVSKDTTKVHSGLRSLKVVAAMSGEGVVSDALLSMTNLSAWTSDTGDGLTGPVGREMTYIDDTTRFSPGHIGWYLYSSGNDDPNNDGEFVISRYLSDNSIKFENPSGSPTTYYDGPFPPPPNTAVFQIRPRYEIAVWAATDVEFTVEVDQGDGSFVSVGSIPANGGVFTLHKLFFKRLGSGSSFIRFVAQGAGTLYIGGVHVYTSVWEKPALLKAGTDGIITSPDQFSTAGSFTFDASDIGRVVFVWDPTNNKNSGAYRITAVAAGVATLDLRSGSASLTTQGALNWRLDTIDYLTYPNNNFSTSQNFCGFGLESPHASKWRFFLRQSQVVGQTGKGSILWSAPEDTDFDFGKGSFYKTGPSTMRSRQGDWVKIPDSSAATDEYLWRGGYTYKTSPTDSRFFFMTDEDGSFFHFFLWDEDGGHGCFLIGYLGGSLPGIESFYHFSRWEGRNIGNECDFDGTADVFATYGGGYDTEKLSIACCIAQLGIGISDSSGDEVATQSNAGPNPWSGQEWLRPLILWRDFWMNRAMAALENSDAGLGIYQGRSNMNSLTTLDSETRLHLNNGVVWEWSGETVV